MSSESGPPSIVKPSTCSDRITPPTRGARSSTTRETSRRESSYAAERPAMPAPTIATSTDIGLDEILEHRDEGWRCVEGFGAPQRCRQLACRLRRLHVDVEQDLRVVAHETNWHRQKLPHAGCRSIFKQ